ncbi:MULTISPECIES: DUF317 domain-containing protein [Streptomyces]|uniref:DUF317 domain-containing protein n=1 Tax=Streptomyces cavourensis TaxID=67258 RepID=A0ABY5FAD5_9ACTN|nr:MULTISPECIES: DUF317 domain-containing protein [Streptomyces]UTR80638.1 DUF317 domain-containing protein [Streptomyces cavourensis]WST13414.1 DUF317 domain-containing protein [Streptomyces microflavus]SCK26919.1 protein of unknown function [Streptomyces sp. ScaeMP-e48]
MAVVPFSPGFSTTIEALRLREWQLGPGQPTLLTDQFCADGFHLIVDDRADVHISSKGGRFCIGWFPNGRPGTNSEGWTIAVTGAIKAPGYRISFDTEPPSDIVSAAVARVLETSRRV